MSASGSPASQPVAIAKPLTIVLAIAALWNVTGNLWLPGEWYVPANLAIAAILVAIARWAGLSWHDLGLARRDVPRGLWVGLLAMLVVGLVIALLVAVPASRSFFESDEVDADGAGTRWYTAVVRIPLGTAVFEEVLFRAVLLGLVLRRTSRVWAVTITSVLFGLWHIVPAWEDTSGSTLSIVAAIIGTVAITTAAGALFAGLRLWSASTIAPILAHTATNSFAYVAAIVALDVAAR